jgi:hypothetical protein
MDPLDLLKDRLQYWTEERKNEFYGMPPPNKKYGEGWHWIWEDTELGKLYIHKRYDRSSTEVVLEGNNNKFYSLNNQFGEKDWNIFQEVYVESALQREFRFEVPVHHEIVNIDGVDWSFTVTQAPYGSIGTDGWSDAFDNIEDPNFLNILIEQTGLVAKSLNNITQRYNEGMTPHIFCGTLRWKNESGYYFRVPGHYAETYNDAMIRGLALFKILHITKYNSLRKLHNLEPVDPAPYVALAKEKWKL